jgi:predicted negative regulator of RcsB-dependent stress response
VKLRVLAHVVGVVWRSSTAGKALIVVVVLSLVAVFGYVIYSVFFAG